MGGTLSVRISSSVTCGGAAAGASGVTAGAGAAAAPAPAASWLPPAKPAATAATARSARAALARSACCRLSRSSSACSWHALATATRLRLTGLVGQHKEPRLGQATAERGPAQSLASQAQARQALLNTPACTHTFSLARATSSSLRSAFHTRSRASRSAIILRRLALAPACRAARAALALPSTHRCKLAQGRCCDRPRLERSSVRARHRRVLAVQSHTGWHAWPARPTLRALPRL